MKAHHHDPIPTLHRPPVPLLLLSISSLESIGPQDLGLGLVGTSKLDPVEPLSTVDELGDLSRWLLLDEDRELSVDSGDVLWRVEDGVRLRARKKNEESQREEERTKGKERERKGKERNEAHSPSRCSSWDP